MKTTKIIILWSIVIGFLAQGFGQKLAYNPNEIKRDSSVSIDWLSGSNLEDAAIRALDSRVALYSELDLDSIPEKHFEFSTSYTLEMRHYDPNYTTDTVDAVILVSTNNLPVHTIQGKWIKYRWATNWIVDWWSKPEDQILDINFQSLDPSYYVWDYKTKK